MALTEHEPPAREADDWEAAVMRRVARHLEELPAPPVEAEDFGWEEDVLEKLRQRLAANE